MMLSNLFNEDFWEQLYTIINETKNNLKYEKLKQMYWAKISPTLVDNLKENQLTLNAINETDKAIQKLVLDYKAELSSFCNTHGIIFQRPDDNIKNIKAIADDIKEKAIQPSFDIFKQTSADMKEVQTGLTTVSL